MKRISVVNEYLLPRGHRTGGCDPELAVKGRGLFGQLARCRAAAADKSTAGSAGFAAMVDHHISQGHQDPDRARVGLVAGIEPPQRHGDQRAQQAGMGGGPELGVGVCVEQMQDGLDPLIELRHEDSRRSSNRAWQEAIGKRRLPKDGGLRDGQRGQVRRPP